MKEMSFSQRLLKVMKQKKISQVRISKAMNLSRAAVNKWTKGGMIDDGNLELLSNFLDVDMIWLKYGEQADNNSVLPLSDSRINQIQVRDSTEVVTWEWDLLTDEVIYSDNVEQVYGLKLTSNEDYWALISKESRDYLNSDYEKIINNGGAHEMDFNLVKDGVSRWITSRAIGVKGPNGKITRMVGVSLDNTERKNSELKLLGLNNFFKTLLSHFDRLVVFCDPLGEIQASNLDNFEQKISYLELQAMLYNLVLQHENTIARVKKEGSGELEFEGQKMAIYYHDDENKQPYFMMKFNDL